jgi:anti-sigma B factor antagonist
MVEEAEMARGDLLNAEQTALSNGTALVQLTGEVDISSAHVLTSQFQSAAENGWSNVIIDATGVSFMDSTGLHALVEGKRLLHESGTRIVLVPSPQVRRVLELVFPDPLFAVRVDSVDEALRHVETETGQPQA